MIRKDEMKLEGNPFQNSSTCKGIGYKDSDAIDFAVIEITGRYPENGWAVNEVIYEMVYVIKGSGSVVVKDTQHTLLAPGEVVSIKPGERFAWKGNMTLAVACSPAFDFEQYKLEEDDEI